MTSQIVSVCMVFENDAAIAADVVHELHATLSARFENFEILAVDNGSTNDTVSRVLTVAEPLDNIRILILAKQYDIEIASFAALENAIGDYVVLFEPRTDPCHVEPQLVAKCMEGHDLVSGKAEDRCDDTGWRPLFSTLFQIPEMRRGHGLGAIQIEFQKVLVPTDDNIHIGHDGRIQDGLVFGVLNEFAGYLGSDDHLVRQLRQKHVNIAKQIRSLACDHITEFRNNMIAQY